MTPSTFSYYNHCINDIFYGLSIFFGKIFDLFKFFQKLHVIELYPAIDGDVVKDQIIRGMIGGCFLRSRLAEKMIVCQRENGNNILCLRKSPIARAWPARICYKINRAIMGGSGSMV